jgi:ABC-type glycerol-3-phosphate transport system substrate-binding protein
MRGRILAALATVALVGAVVQAHAQAQAQVTVTWSTLAGGGPAVSDVYRALTQQFERQTPGVRINLQVLPGTSGEQYNRYVTLFAAKDASVDVISIDVIWPAPMVAAGWLAPLDQWFTPDKREVFLPGAIRANTIGGKVYGVPWYTDAGLLYYRKDLLAKYNAKVPATWDEMISERHRVAGGRVIEQVMALDRIPLYGREGALVPLGPAVQDTGELGPDVAISDLLVFGPPRPEMVPRGLGL